MTRSGKKDVIRKSELGRSRREGLRLVREGAKEDVSGEKGVLGQVIWLQLSNEIIDANLVKLMNRQRIVIEMTTETCLPKWTCPPRPPNPSKTQQIIQEHTVA